MQEENITRAIIVVQMGMTPSAKQVKPSVAPFIFVLYWNIVTPIIFFFRKVVYAKGSDIIFYLCAKGLRFLKGWLGLVDMEMIAINKGNFTQYR